MSEKLVPRTEVFGCFYVCPEYNKYTLFAEKVLRHRSPAVVKLHIECAMLET